MTSEPPHRAIRTASTRGSTTPVQRAMRTLPNGDLLVASAHSWTQNDTPIKKSQLYRFDSVTGDVIWRWPSEGALPKVIRWFDVSADGKTLALITDAEHNLQGSTVEGDGAGNGTLSVLNAEDGTENWHADIEPLRAYFRRSLFGGGLACLPMDTLST